MKTWILLLTALVFSPSLHAGDDLVKKVKKIPCEKNLVADHLDGVDDLRKSLLRTYSGLGEGVKVFEFDVLESSGSLSDHTRKIFSRYNRWTSVDIWKLEGFPFTLDWDDYAKVAADIRALPKELRKSFVVEVTPGRLKNKLPEGHSALRWLEILAKSSKKRKTGVGFAISREFDVSSYTPVFFMFPSPELLAAFIRAKFPGFEGNLQVGGFEGSALGQTWPDLRYEIEPSNALGALRTLSSIVQILDEVNRASQDPTIELVLKQAAGISIAKGRTFVTPDGLRCTVVKEMESGTDRVVYRVKTDDGRDLIYKAARTRNQDHIDGIDKDAERAREMERIGLPHARLIEHTPGSAYLLREYTPGERGDDWIARWVREGARRNSPELKQLIELFKLGIEKNAYVGKLDPEDAIYQQGKGWIIVDSGRVKEEFPREEVILLYAIRTTELWSAKINDSKVKKKFEDLIQGALVNDN